MRITTTGAALCLLALIICPSLVAQDVARYTFNNESLASSDPDDGSVASNLVAFNSTMFYVGSSNTYLCLTTDWDESAEQGPFNNSQNYLEFSVAPNALRVLNLSSVNLIVSTGTNRAVDAVAVYADEDPGPGGDNFQTKLAEDLDIYNNSGQANLNLSGVAFLQGTEGPVTIRLYFWNRNANGNGATEVCQICLEGSSPAGMAKIGDYVWLDTDEDGIQDANEPGVQDVVTHLIDEATGAILETTTTDADGLYCFLVDAGSYRVCWELPPGFSFTQVDAGTNGNIDSDADPATGCTTHVINVNLGDIKLFNDAGLLPCVGVQATSVDLGPSCNLALDPIFTVQPPVLGTFAMASVESQFPNALGYLFASLPPVTPYEVPGIGCTIYVDILNPSNFYLLTHFFTDANGDFEIGLPIPNMPGMQGLELILQVRLCAPNGPPGPIFPDWVSNGVMIRAGCP